MSQKEALIRLYNDAKGGLVTVDRSISSPNHWRGLDLSDTPIECTVESYIETDEKNRDIKFFVKLKATDNPKNLLAFEKISKDRGFKILLGDTVTIDITGREELVNLLIQAAVMNGHKEEKYKELANEVSNTYYSLLILEEERDRITKEYFKQEDRLEKIRLNQLINGLESCIWILQGSKNK